jgi:pimeloyl-ACP methyl ester carboxylesterase
VNVFYREAGPDSGKVLFLLHGSAFNSGTWMNTKTVQSMAAAGNKVYAVDLPGTSLSNAIYYPLFNKSMRLSETFLIDRNEITQL